MNKLFFTIYVSVKQNRGVSPGMLQKEMTGLCLPLRQGMPASEGPPGIEFDKGLPAWNKK